MFKKICSIFLVIILLISVGSTGFAEVKSSEKMDWLKENKLITGRENGELDLDKEINRAEIATIFVRAAKVSEEKVDKFKAEDSKFKDVSKDFWANGFINAANKYGLIKGYEDGTFGPKKPIKYNEVLAIAVRMDTRWTEVLEENAIWPQSYIDAAKEYELLEGLEIEDFSNVAVRGEVFEVLYNLVNSKTLRSYEGIIDEIKEEVEEVKEEVKEKVEEVKEKLDEESEKIIADMKAFVASLDETILQYLRDENEDDKKNISEIKELIEKSKKLAEDETMDSAKRVEEIKEIYALNEKGKAEGKMRKAVKKAPLVMSMDIEKAIKNKSGEEFSILEGDVIKIKTPIKVEDDKIEVYFNYVVKKDYDENIADVVSGATPKYNKERMDEEFYKVTKTEDGYEFKINKLPEDVVIIKPIIKLPLGKAIKLENGLLVFVEK